MLKHITILCFIVTLTFRGFTQYFDSTQKLIIQYKAAIEFSDAAINSIAALNSLIKKENYRNKILSFNNPTSSDMGFNLQLEINTALKPLLEKAKHVNTNKFMDVVGCLVGNQSKTGLTKSFIPTTGIFSTLTSLVGNLTISEKRITKNDLDSFILSISKYFGQYEKLNRINQQFDISIDKTDVRLQELQTDLKDYLLDLILAYNNSLQRSTLKQKTTEELLLKFLEKSEIEKQLNNQQETNNLKPQTPNNVYFPTDAIKAAKDITSTIQKIFTEYQKIYTANYNDIRNILNETKQLGSNINKQTINNSLAELQTLYTESKNADVLILRISTLTERLKTLVATEKIK
ncbi:MAG: hypothetical protein KGZ59_10895 [Chitinophagaceae bacterium]|nr:hypothetical protein [Chitinophagaceae bacterium]